MEEVGLEVRWIILSTDGRHVTVGRHTDPSPEEVTRAEASLIAQGLTGWLVLLKGDYYARQQPTLIRIRNLGTPSCLWEDAVVLFQKSRDRTVGAPAS
jgi:hypothetical protein